MIETPVMGPAGMRALVVDDEPHIVEVVRECLEEQGYEVHGSGTAAGALDLIRKGRYDLMFLDIMLPDMDGILAHSRVRDLDPDLARNTVFMSGWAKNPAVRDYLCSIGRFLPKPFSVDDLVRMARSLN